MGEGPNGQSIHGRKTKNTKSQKSIIKMNQLPFKWNQIKQYCASCITNPSNKKFVPNRRRSVKIWKFCLFLPLFFANINIKSLEIFTFSEIYTLLFQILEYWHLMRWFLLSPIQFFANEKFHQKTSQETTTQKTTTTISKVYVQNL